MDLGNSLLLFTCFYFVAYFTMLFANRLYTVSLLWPAQRSPLHAAHECTAAHIMQEEFGHNLVLYLSCACMALMSISAVQCTDILPLGGTRRECFSVFEEASATRQSALLRAARQLLQLPASPQTPFALFAGGAAACNAITAVQFWRAVPLPVARRWARTYAVATTAAAGIWTIAAGVAHTYTARVACGAAAVALLMGADFVSRAPGVHMPTLLPAHLSSRFRKFGVVMLTQVVLAVLRPEVNYNADCLLFSAEMLALLVLFKIVYFDFDQGSRGDRFTGWPLLTEWLYVLFNLALTAAITAMGATAGAILSQLEAGASAGDSGTDHRIKWVLCVSLGGGMLASCGIQMALKGAGSRVRVCRKRHRVGSRALVSLGVMLLPLVLPAHWSHLQVLLLLLCSLLLQMVLDMYGRQRRYAPRNRAELQELAASDDSAVYLTGYGALPTMAPPAATAAARRGVLLAKGNGALYSDGQELAWAHSPRSNDTRSAVHAPGGASAAVAAPSQPRSLRLMRGFGGGTSAVTVAGQAQQVQTRGGSRASHGQSAGMELTADALRALEQAEGGGGAGVPDDDNASVMSSSSSLADYLLGNSPRLQPTSAPLSPMQQPLNGVGAGGGGGSGGRGGGVGAAGPTRSDAKMLYL